MVMLFQHHHERLYRALRRRDIFACPSVRWADPRAQLLDGTGWQGEAVRPASGQIELPYRLRRHEALTLKRRQARMDDPLDNAMNRDHLAPPPETIHPRLERG